MTPFHSRPCRSRSSSMCSGTSRSPRSPSAISPSEAVMSEFLDLLIPSPPADTTKTYTPHPPEQSRTVMPRGGRPRQHSVAPGRSHSLTVGFVSATCSPERHEQVAIVHKQSWHVLAVTVAPWCDILCGQLATQKLTKPRDVAHARWDAAASGQATLVVSAFGKSDGRSSSYATLYANRRLPEVLPRLLL